jgi:hypothetical protein
MKPQGASVVVTVMTCPRQLPDFERREVMGEVEGPGCNPAPEGARGGAFCYTAAQLFPPGPP